MNFDLKIWFQPKNYLYFLILQKTQIQHVPSNTHGAVRILEKPDVGGKMAIFQKWLRELFSKYPILTAI